MPIPSPGGADLRGRCALVTGSTGGLGLAIATALAEAGSHVVLHGLADPAEMEETCLALSRRCDVQALYHRADLARAEPVEGLMEAAAAPTGQVDILVNNAAIRHFGPIDQLSPAGWEADIAVNLNAAFHTIRLALPGMRAAGWGRIVNMASIYGLVGATGRAGYVTTKTALIGLSRAVALETARQGITCNALCPGTVLTPNIEDRIGTMMRERDLDADAAAAEFLHGKQPTGRFVEATAVAAMVVFLCGPAGRDVTGTALPMDGGWSAG
ncbi:SDR family oxidoreductase [Roseomonas sp. NAR14]|uniref:SDR family oxidoreductase n=1 Tax=Roseomonas acroporae TaxID=2937791 RepID=A0A9X2BZ46_9PROT|nr:SDR family oxidoreductase [Roseomonas acroporae]MCK8787664.1 SDR family oxidoreductase [Roseomonas acroporae]